ncbi:MAG: hypothetical protein NWQ45_10225, partial [Congregibacter sp.]|nr:hypothetical protein [Congregibacter sp.]
MILLACLFYTAVFNYAFFQRFSEIFPLSWRNALLILSAFVLVWAAHTLFFSLLAGRFTTRALLVSGMLV